MPVIAMTCELGALGTDVANGVAQELDLEMAQHEVIEHVAAKLGLEGNEVADFFGNKIGWLDRRKMDKRGISLFTAEKIFELALNDNVVIQGWPGPCLLHPVSHIACVRVLAAMRLRCKTLVERHVCPDEITAQRKIEADDAACRSTMYKLFRAVPDPVHYDISLNSGNISVDDCVEVIKCLVSCDAMRQTAASGAELNCLALNARIRAALYENPRTRPLRSPFAVTVDPGSGAVTLSGMVDTDELRREAESIVVQLPGVGKVDNQVIAASGLKYDH